MIYQPKVCIQIGLFTNAALTIFKFFAGIVGLSKAMVADALHSFSDILTTVVVYVGICIAERPADEDHPYGHGNAETIAAAIVALIILGLGIYAAKSAVSSLIQGQFKQPLAIALWAAIASILAKEALFRYTIKVGQLNNNPAVIADAWHHRSDVYSSLAALVGIAGAKISFLYLDPLAGLVVAALIVKIAFPLIRSNIGIMMDEKPNAGLISNIEGIVQNCEGVKKIDSIKVHRRGSHFTIDLELSVDSSISVAEGHKIAARVRDKLRKKIRSVRDVMVHVNPYK
ncbi:MAG: cation transporter [Candidatus Omnitrophica bacterium]|nr:cation transporter [Candidatus Omnitrophota bacterium]